jgi:hypothetical protein
LAKKGRLSAGIIDSAEEMPRHMTYIIRFGSLRRAYELIGYQPDNFKIQDGKRAATAVVSRLADELVAKIQAAGHYAAFDPASCRLAIAPDVTVSIIPALCQRMAAGSLRWPVRRRIDRGSTLVLAARMRDDNQSILDYFLIPTNRIRGRLRFTKSRRAALDRYRLTAVDALAEALQRAPAAPRGEPKQKQPRLRSQRAH